MRPTLVPGDRVYVDPRPGRPFARGDIVVVRDPEEPGRFLVKRVDAVTGDRPREGGLIPAEAVFLVGDNPGPSRDSRHFGPVDRRWIVGLVWFRYAPSSRRGPPIGTFK
jgi:signal peptidase I